MYDRTKVRNTCYVTIRHANISAISLGKHFLEETKTRPPFLSMTLKEMKGRIVWVSFDRRKNFFFEYKWQCLMLCIIHDISFLSNYVRVYTRVSIPT